MKGGYFLGRGRVDAATAGVVSFGAAGLIGVGIFFGFFASLLPR